MNMTPVNDDNICHLLDTDDEEIGNRDEDIEYCETILLDIESQIIGDNSIFSGKFIKILI